MLMVYEQKPPLNILANLSSKIRGLIFREAHRIVVLMVYEQKPPLNILANISSEVRGFNLHPCSVYACGDLLFFSSYS